MNNDRTRSMTDARRDLELDQVFVVYPGMKRFPLGEGIEALGLPALLELLEKPSGTSGSARSR